MANVVAASEPVKPPVSNWNIANILTMIRIAMVPVFAWLLLRSAWQTGFPAGGGVHQAILRPWWDAAHWHQTANLPLRWWAFAIFVLAMATDKLDGHLARSRGLITDLGKLLDPIADKALTGVAFVLLAFPLREIPWWIPAIILVREWGITIMRMRLRRYAVLPAGRGGKLKTVLQSIAIPLLLLPLATLPHWVSIVAWVVLGAATIVTLVTGIEYAISGWKLYQSRNQLAEVV